MHKNPKILASLFVVICVHIEVIGQMPLPCLNYSNDNVNRLYSFHGSKSVACMEINMSETPIHMNDNDVRDYQVQQASIKPGYSYSPSGNNGRFSITLGERQEMEGAWFEPINYFPQLYEKIEWGLKLPEVVEQAIANWIDNDQDGTNLTPALNPFDPDQIDVKAIVDYTDENGNYHSQTVYGFFYRDYQRITVYNNPYNENMDDPDNWRWQEMPTDYRFRFRWASDVIARHSVRLTVNVPSMGYWELAPFEFDSYWGDPRNSFISVTDNGHYFKTDDGHIFFPVGLNINEGTFGCNCMEGVTDTDDCEDCYEDGLLDPCCEIHEKKRRRTGIAPLDAVEIGAGPEFEDTGVESYTLAAAAYVKLERTLQKLKDNGGNAFRTLFDPLQYDIEFEKLNNYYDRQFQAWEFDQVLNKCRELDLRVELNLMIHYALTSHPFGMDKFDWDYSQNCDGCGDEVGNNHTHGYCYWRELGLDTPIDFITDPLAIVNYKKKIRYIIARYGYSRNIFLMELLSEANNIGKVWLNEENADLNGDGDSDDTRVDIADPYSEQYEIVRPALANWHNEIASFIKNDLQHSRHLIAADYTGLAPMSYYPDQPEVSCASDYFDDSWQKSNIDVIAWNDYGFSIDRFNRKAMNEYYEMYCWDATFENTGNTYSVPINGFEFIPKPVVYPESGFIDAFGCDNTGFVKELMMTPFTGHATSGMSWDEWSTVESWHWAKIIRDFLEFEVFNSIDIGAGQWRPGWVESQPNGKAEAVYLLKTETNHKKAVGVISNRTWNWFTVGNGGFCDEIPYIEDDDGNFSVNDATLPSALHNLTSFGDSEEHLRIPQMEVLKRYKIQYIDPVTLTVLNEENVNTIDAALRLENYPIISENRPFVFFKIWRNPAGSDEEPFMPLLSFEEPVDKGNQEAASSMLSETTSMTEINSADQSELVSIFPNPTTKKIQIKTNGNLPFNLSISDHLGSIVLNIQISEPLTAVDLSACAAGVYFMRTGLSTVHKIIIIE